MKGQLLVTLRDRAGGKVGGWMSGMQPDTG